MLHLLRFASYPEGVNREQDDEQRAHCQVTGEQPVFLQPWEHSFLLAPVVALPPTTLSAVLVAVRCEPMVAGHHDFALGVRRPPVFRGFAPRFFSLWFSARSVAISSCAFFSWRRSMSASEL
jgi:hypothetical protein